MTFENKILFHSKMTFHSFRNHSLFEIIKYTEIYFNALPSLALSTVQHTIYTICMNA